MFRAPKVLVAGLVAIVSLLAFSTAASAQYQTQPTVTVDRPVVVQGESVTISGADWDPACNVVLSYNPVIGEAAVDADGNFSYVWDTTGVPNGVHTVTISQPCSDQTLQVQVSVVAPGSSVTPGVTPGTTGTLPRTGSDSTGMLLRGGLVLLAIGGLALLAGRRWRNESPA